MIKIWDENWKKGGSKGGMPTRRGKEREREKKKRAQNANIKTQIAPSPFPLLRSVSQGEAM
jgi:hypothetical protein